MIVFIKFEIIFGRNESPEDDVKGDDDDHAGDDGESDGQLLVQVVRVQQLEAVGGIVRHLAAEAIAGGWFLIGTDFCNFGNIFAKNLDTN
jgi:hypothetical protein